MNALEVAISYIRRGWSPIPLPFKKKKPAIPDWPNLRITEADAPRYFNGAAQNIGVLMGEASGGLSDVDLDCGEALAVAPYFLPPTPALFGRPGNPSSHWLYKTGLAEKRDIASIDYADPCAPKDEAMLVQLRIGGGGKGAQTVFPGSIHETGEVIKWEVVGEPAEVDGEDLHRRVGCLAAAALLARYWPGQGKRHKAAMAVGGLLARGGWKEPDAKLFIEAVAKAAGDQEWWDRRKAVEDSFSTVARGDKATGLPTLIELIDERVARRVVEWLGLTDRFGFTRRAANGGSGGTSSAPAADPSFEDEFGPSAAAVDADALPFVGFDDLQVEVQKPWLLKKVIAKGETSSWIGGPGKGKSALLTDLAIHVAAQRDWRGYRSRGKFGVVILAFERGDLTKRRLEAYKLKHGFKGLPIVVVTKPVDLMDPGAVAVIVATIKAVAARYGIEVGLLIIDTFAKAIAHGNGDEDRAKDQNRLRGHLREVQRITNVHIALVGHTGKDESRGERGSNANLGDVDVEVRITGDLVKSATVTKANDQPEGPLTKFTLEAYELAVDEDGEAVTTALISAEVPNEQSTNRPNTKLNHAETVALKSLRNALAEGGERPPASNQIPAGVRVIEKDHWRRYCYLAGISAEDKSDDARRMAFKRAVEGLQKKGLIGVWEPYVWEISQ